MGIFRNIVLGFVGCVLTSGSAKACNPPMKFDVNYIESAEIVVIGRIVNYRSVKDMEARKRRIQMLEGYPALQEYFLENMDAGHLADHARFEIEIDEVILGPAQKTISVVWFNSTYGIYKTYAEGPFLIALHDLPPSLLSPVSPAIKDDLLGSNLWNVLQAPCHSPFIIGTGGTTEAAVRKILAAPSRIVSYTVFGAGTFLLLCLLWFVFLRTPARPTPQ